MLVLRQKHLVINRETCYGKAELNDDYAIDMKDASSLSLLK